MATSEICANEIMLNQDNKIFVLYNACMAVIVNTYLSIPVY